MINVGNCGWGYLNCGEFFEEKWKTRFKSVLQAYSSLFPTVEINSTFYRIPKLSTAEKWRKEADEINKDFEFTVKCSQIVTHLIRFTKGSVKTFNTMKDICKKLDAKVLLFQSPASFRATEENIKRMTGFFGNIDKDDLIFVWEPRGDWHKNPNLIKQICKEFELVECVDPFRNDSVYFGKAKISYFRLHGFGLISMYSYNFNIKELEDLKEKIEKMKKKVKDFYVMFNNSNCYKNALQFMKLIEK